MSLNSIPITEKPLQRKVTKTPLQREHSGSSTSTTASSNSRDMATQTTAEAPVSDSPNAARARNSDVRNPARMSGGASSDKSVTFDAASPEVSYFTSKARNSSSTSTSPSPEIELVHDKKKSAKRPSFKRNLSSLWKILDPPELAHNTGCLHNLVQDEKSADGTTLVETLSPRQHKHR